MNKQGTSILLAEDNPTNLFYLETVIKKHFPSITLLIAHNGVEAIEIYRLYCPDIILLDLYMPLMNGDVAAAEIRRCAGDLSHHPIIIGLTAALPTAKADLFKQHIDTWLTKPITKEQLKTLINKQLETISNHQQQIATPYSLSHYDFQELSISLGHDKLLIAEVLTYAINYIHHFPEEVNTLIEQQNWSVLVRLAHQLRGAALNARFPLMAHLAYIMEHQVIFNKETILKQLEDIKEEAKVLLSLIQPHIGSQVV